MLPRPPSPRRGERQPSVDPRRCGYGRGAQTGEGLMTATIVLVHGAWSGAWMWDALVPELDKRGLAHREMDLPSVGAGAAGKDVTDDARFVRAIVDEVGGPVILAGNS